MKRTSTVPAVVSLQLLFCCGCAGQLRTLSAGEIGCPKDEIEVYDIHWGWGTGSWTAKCRGKVFYCSTGTGFNNCTKAMYKYLSEKYKEDEYEEDEYEEDEYEEDQDEEDQDEESDEYDYDDSEDDEE